MKKQIIFIHGGDAFSKHEDFLEYLRTTEVRNLPGSEASGHWTQTLREDLGEEYEVFMPSMPNKQNALYEEWKIWLERHFKFVGDGVILVGWSLGGMFLAKYLSENKPPVAISALLLLAAPCGTYFDPTGNDCGTFQFNPSQLPEITKNISKISIWHSKDDFVVPIDHQICYQKNLPEAEILTFMNKNHFLQPTFEELVNKLRKI